MSLGGVSSIILWITSKISKVKVCVVVVYGPSEGDGEERVKFWNELDRIVDKVVMGIDYGY